MRAEAVDAHIIAAQDVRPRFRLYTFEGAAPRATAGDLWDCSVDAALEEGSRWNETHLWSLALVNAHGSTTGLVWLSGYDYR